VEGRQVGLFYRKFDLKYDKLSVARKQGGEAQAT